MRSVLEWRCKTDFQGDYTFTATCGRETCCFLARARCPRAARGACASGLSRPAGRGPDDYDSAAVPASDEIGAVYDAQLTQPAAFRTQIDALACLL